MPALDHDYQFPLDPYPPPLSHKVWILDCNSCGSFLTNRAMKAVLLLRPDVPLYSSDALPVNCSAYSFNPDALHPSEPQKMTPSSSSRTCECLTQSLFCHGCGNAIGYMIVVPCARCTFSVTVNNRSTNGHRFVFHSSEVLGIERRYIKNEPGVIPFDPAPRCSPVSFQLPHYSPAPFTRYLNHRDPSYEQPILRSDYLPTPPLEFARSLPPLSSYQSPEPDTLSALGQPQRLSSSSAELSDLSSPPPLPSPTPSSAERKDAITPPTLNPGDIIFWHHLVRSGEILGVFDDERARIPDSAGSTNTYPGGVRLHR